MDSNKVEKPDILKLYFGYDYWVTDRIMIHHPTIREIVDYGEERFWDFIIRFAGNTTSMRLALWDIGIDWNKISDYELFVMLCQTFEPKDTSLLFGSELDFTKFIALPFQYKKEEDDEPIEKVILVNPEDPTLMLDEDSYQRMVDYIRLMVGYNPKREFAKNKVTKKNIIEEERQNIKDQERLRKKEPIHNSVLLSMVSFVLNHPGCKYKKSELIELDIFEFMDSIKRIQNTEATLSLMRGMYSGMLDTSKLNLNKELDLTRDLYQV